jgi:SAM-dependent methyltransferase
MPAVQHLKSSSAKSDVLSLAMPILVCPACGAGLGLKDSGARRRDCGRIYSCDPRDGVIYFVEEESYAESFGLQWKTFSREQLDNDQLRDSEGCLRRETGLFPEQFAGKIILDAGCGMGRFLDVVSRGGAALAVGVDLSSAVNAAAANLSDRDNVLMRLSWNLGIVRKKYFAGFAKPD